jgi:hypothetical protein
MLARPIRALRTGSGDDRGAAMLLVIGFSVLMLGLALVASQAAIRQIRPSARADHSYAALSAAEAGIFDYHKHLLDDPTYYLEDEDNPALTGWVTIPGYAGNSAVSDSEYTLRVDRTRLGSAGELVVYAVGRSPKDLPGTADDTNQVVRAVQAIWSKRSTLDYVYMSDIETPAPDLPGAYSTAANSGGTGKTAQELARLLCSRRFYESGQVDPTGTQGKERNMNFCQWAGIYNTENLVGRIHTNDVWRFDAVDLSSTLDAGSATSSCRTTGDGLLSGEVGCGTVRRYIDTGGSGSPSSLRSNNGSGAKWTSTGPGNGTAYQTDSWVGSNSTPDPTKRSPGYATVLELPQTPALLKKRAGDTGCVFTGPTRLDFASDGSVYVTSPDTKYTATLCGGGANGAYLSSGTATAPKTSKINLADFVDPVFYVQDVQRAAANGADPDPAFNYDVANQWPLTNPATEPTCKTKAGTNVYPFVIPDLSVDTGEASHFVSNVSGSNYKGFPSEFADVASPWYSGNCAMGDAYVQGRFAGRVTLATENNIVITGSIAEAGGSTATCGSNLRTCTYGQPSANSDSLIGLVSKKFTYLYRPSGPVTTYSNGSEILCGGQHCSPRQYVQVPSTTTTWALDWNEANAHDPILNVAILAISECFASQDPYWGTYPQDPVTGQRNGNIYLWGSLAQKYRCVVGSTGGYNKVYKYDDRLLRVVPPAMLELSDEDWGSQTSGSDAAIRAPFSEITLFAQKAGDASVWTPLDTTADYQPVITNLRVVSGGVAVPAVQTRTVNGTSLLAANVQAASAGVVVLRYDITTGKAGSAKTIKESRSVVISVNPA